jgi:nucleoside-diphosphate-sugar epimerase
MTVYAGLDVLVTGGLGFIGSNLVIRLVEAGAKVTVVDPMLPGCGANLRNIAPVRDAVRVIGEDIADAHLFREELRRASVVFNLAGEISHVHSMQFPERDLQVNTISQLRFLLACKECARHARIVYASTRQVYGVPKYLPVDEGHPIRPVDFNGVHKFAATSYHLMLTRAGYLDAAVLRLTNVYGPRMALDAVCQGFLSTFLRRMVLGQQIEIFGDGSQARDPLYIDDAVNAFLLLGAVQQPVSRCYNAGGPNALSLAAIAHTASAIGGCPAPVFTPFPPDRKPIDIGSYVTDNRRIERELGWKPRVKFDDGIQRAMDFYRSELRHYIDPAEPDPPCRMHEHSGGPYHLTYVKVAEGAG